jgi:iron complex transport system permease protein
VPETGRAHDAGTAILRTVAGFGAMAAAAVLLAPLAGPTSISLRRAFDFSIPFADNRTRRSSSSPGCRGRSRARWWAALFAAAGVVFQGLLRNPLATPFTLGVSTGAALGAILAITFNWSIAVAGISAVPVAAFAGSLVAVGIVYALAQARHRGCRRRCCSWRA